MDNNIITIQNVIKYIDLHLEESLDLEKIAKKTGYSKYHLHRMFTAIVGFPIHTYLQRRKLTEAARALVFSDTPIIEIAFSSGYKTQQSFTKSFKSAFHCTPRAYRKRRDFFPLQLTFDVNGIKQLRGDMILDIKMVQSEKILLIGYCKSTKRGFHVIGASWRKLHANKHKIPNRTDMDFLIGLNDYSAHPIYEENQPVFDYYAAAQAGSIKKIPKGMVAKELPAGKYIIFLFKGKNEDSMQPVVEYIYKTWFPHSTCQLNETTPYDFVKYGEDIDAQGESNIEYWVPIL